MRRGLDRNKYVIAGGNLTAGAALVTGGTAAVESFGVGYSAVSAGTAMLASAETTAAAIPLIGGKVAAAVGTVGTGATALGTLLAPVTPIIAGAALGWAIVKIFFDD